MPKIVVTAAVKDVEAWLKFKPQLIAQMSAVASGGTSYVAMDGSNRVAARRAPSTCCSSAAGSGYFSM